MYIKNRPAVGIWLIVEIITPKWGLILNTKHVLCEQRLMRESEKKKLSNPPSVSGNILLLQRQKVKIVWLRVCW